MSSCAAVARAIEAGINWFDTVLGYGQGKSETNLGRVPFGVRAKGVHVATKVRIADEIIRPGRRLRPVRRLRRAWSG